MFEQLADVFPSAAFKYLSEVDANPKKSNQHEIGGLVKAGIGPLLGMEDGGTKKPIDATMVYLDDTDKEPVIEEDIVTWYDTRFSNAKRSAEWRLYYKTNEVTARFRAGDFFVVAVTKERRLLLMFCPPGGEAELELRTLFGVRDSVANPEGKLTRVEPLASTLSLPIRMMFDRIGIEISPAGNSYLEQILELFGAVFPTTREFSELSRSLANKVCPNEAPDEALLTWMETEELAFRQLEKHIVQEKLRAGFGERGDDVDEFIHFSLSVQNRRKSRSGHAFENHIEFILSANGVKFERGAKTEGKQKPDFLFPGTSDYTNSSYPSGKLRILGAKTTCKDRWRQVLAEAERIDRKHLITMQTGISLAQTKQMADKNLQLVVPESLQRSYLPQQQEWLMSFSDFISEVRELNS